MNAKIPGLYKTEQAIIMMLTEIANHEERIAAFAKEIEEHNRVPRPYPFNKQCPQLTITMTTDTAKLIVSALRLLNATRTKLEHK